MKRTTAPGSSGGLYVDDNPALGVVGTLNIAEDRNGIQEELINAILGAGFTPSGADLAQLREAIKVLGVPAGTIASFAGSTPPTRWLICDGSAVSRSLYADLFAAIGETWGSGDGSTTFNLPDLREAALQGVGTRASGAASHDAATLGQYKDDQMQGHLHSYFSSTGSGSRLFPTLSAGERNTGYGDSLSFIGGPTNDGANGSPRLGPVTRGKRVGVHHIIKF